MKQVLVCCGTGCLASGSMAVLNRLKELTKEQDVTISPQFKTTGCNGFCENGPIVKIVNENGENISYYKVKVEDAEEIVNETLKQDKVIARLCFTGENGRKVVSQEENPFYVHQKKTALRNIGLIDPRDISDYEARGGYRAIRKALEKGGEWVIREVEEAGLRGRGGAGFPTASKWRVGAGQDREIKYIVCNGDEGDPGAFMDRSILEGDPHSVIEGMLVAAVAVGATHGFMYIRDEYSLALKNVACALESARKAGYLGDNILGSKLSFDIEVVRGGGAFVCGEETALLQSIEGKVGEPRYRPPYPSVSGLWGYPTVTNNVETLANIPVIIAKGGANFAQVGTETSKGTKVFSMVGKVQRTGLVEVPMGITLKELIYEIGGGIKNGRAFKAVQTGGPSGGCIPASMLELPVDFDTLANYGAMMGSGGMIVLDDTNCMVEVARYYVSFLCEESCGKCVPCREGLRQMQSILTDICEGRGQEGDIELLESLAATIQDTAFCALGKTAPNPVLTTIRYFREEYEAHIREKRCPAGVCKALTVFEIDPDHCVGCGACAKACPVKAISGTVKNPHLVDAEACIACGSCREVCKLNAVHPSRRT